MITRHTHSEPLGDDDDEDDDEVVCDGDDDCEGVTDAVAVLVRVRDDVDVTVDVGVGDGVCDGVGWQPYTTAKRLCVPLHGSPKCANGLTAHDVLPTQLFCTHARSPALGGHVRPLVVYELHASGHTFVYAAFHAHVGIGL